jgi:hypothetical protein
LIKKDAKPAPDPITATKRKIESDETLKNKKEAESNLPLEERFSHFYFLSV